MKKEKDEVKALREALFYENQHAGLRMSDEEMKDCEKFCAEYMDFMNTAKIEREVNSFVIAELQNLCQ